jgi:hypothetical protein
MYTETRVDLICTFVENNIFWANGFSGQKDIHPKVNNSILSKATEYIPMIIYDRNVSETAFYSAVSDLLTTKYDYVPWTFFYDSDDNGALTHEVKFSSYRLRRKQSLSYLSAGHIFVNVIYSFK